MAADRAELYIGLHLEAVGGLFDVSTLGLMLNDVGYLKSCISCILTLVFNFEKLVCC